MMMYDLDMDETTRLVRLALDSGYFKTLQRFAVATPARWQMG